MNRNNEISGVVFDEEQYQQDNYIFKNQTSKIVELTIKYSNGYIKNEKQATYAIVVFVVIAVVLSFFFLSTSSGSAQDESQILIEEVINATDAPR